MLSVIFRAHKMHTTCVIPRNLSHCALKSADGSPQ